MDRKLIINADDFGVSEATNKAVKELFKDKKITSTSLLTNAAYSGEAIHFAKELRISVGAHLSLNSDFSVMPWKAMAGLSSLTDEKGFLLSDLKLLAKVARSKDVTSECKAQMDFIKKNGVSIDHIDNHCGTMYGINMRLFFINAYRIARSERVPFRFPVTNRFMQGYFNGKVPKIIKFAHKSIVLTGRLMRVRLIDDMISNPYKMEQIPDYKSLSDYYLNAITNIGDGISELFLHPSYYCPILAPLTGEWKKRQYELEFLFSPEFERRIKDEGIMLISYKDIV